MMLHNFRLVVVVLLVLTPTYSLSKTVFSTNQTVHIGDEDISSWSDLFGQCVNIDLPRVDVNHQLEVTFEPYGIESAYLQYDGKNYKIKSQTPKSGKKRPNYWGAASQVSIKLPSGSDAQKLYICANNISDDPSKVDYDDFMIRAINVASTNLPGSSQEHNLSLTNELVRNNEQASSTLDNLDPSKRYKAEGALMCSAYVLLFPRIEHADRIADAADEVLLSETGATSASLTYELENAIAKVESHQENGSVGNVDSFCYSRFVEQSLWEYQVKRDNDCKNEYKVSVSFCMGMLNTIFKDMGESQAAAQYEQNTRVFAYGAARDRLCYYLDPFTWNAPHGQFALGGIEAKTAKRSDLDRALNTCAAFIKSELQPLLNE